jgi:hypothetical protein
VAAGGKVLGSAAFPFPDTPKDFSGLLQQAQQSGAAVLGLCSFDTDLNNAIKQARTMGLHRTMRIATLIMFASNVPDLGLGSAQGLLLTETFYWDLNDRTRAFTNRIRSRVSQIPVSEGLGPILDERQGHVPGTVDSGGQQERAGAGNGERGESLFGDQSHAARRLGNPLADPAGELLAQHHIEHGEPLRGKEVLRVNISCPGVQSNFVDALRSCLVFNVVH